MKMLQCMRCGWAAIASGDTVAAVMIDDHRVDDLCDGDVREGEM